MSGKKTEKLDEFTGAAGNSVVAEPVGGKTPRRPADKQGGEPMPKIKGLTPDNSPEEKKFEGEKVPGFNSNGEPMPHLKSDGNPLSKVQVMKIMNQYLSGLSKENSIEFFNKISKEWSGRDDTTSGQNAGTKGNEHNRNTIKTYMEDLEELLGSDGLSEDFKKKAVVIFEAVLETKIAEVTTELEEANETKVEEALEEIKEELAEKVDDYLNHVVEQWLESNKVAVVSSLKVEALDSFLDGLKVLFAEHYLSIPEDKVDVAEALSVEVDELEEKLNTEINTGIALRKELNSYKAKDVLESVLTGLTDTQKEKVKSLAEAINFNSIEEYSEKIKTLVEAVSPSTTKPLNEEVLKDEVDPVNDKKVVHENPMMAHYLAAAKRIERK